jgi:YD repeat-containing protein
VVQQGITYQDNHVAYDARGNLRDVADARAHVVMEYDLVGNRTRVATFVDYQGIFGETASGTDRYFKYDAMNRQVVVDAIDATGNLGRQGHAITYDKNGNRTSDTYWGPKLASVGGQQIMIGTNEDGSAIYTTSDVDFVQSEGYSREDYRYDALNRLLSVEKDGMQIDVRYYDGADRVVQSGPAGALLPKYADIINAGLTPEQMNGKETRINRYDANGRLMHQTVLKSDNTLKLNISWDPNEPTTVLGKTYYPDGYDAAGNVRGYTVTNHEAGIINEYSTSFTRFEGYQGTVTQGVSSKQLPGSTTQNYDANGFLVSITDSTQPRNNRTFVNDANGRALYVNQAGNVQRQLIVNGEVLGLYGVGVNPTNPASGYENNPNFANVVDFDFGYAKVSANYPTPSPGAYTVRAGDTLQSIAQGAYGDSSLWYRIAEANGLASSSDMKVGQTLNIPNRVSTINNNATTFKPYDPSQIEGDKTPSLAMPKPKKKSGLGQILMIIVAIVASIFLGPQMLAFVQGALGVSGLAAAVAAGALTGAAVSVISQGVGLATGAQDKFSWKGVALGAIGGGVSAGVSGVPGVAPGQSAVVEFAEGSVFNSAVGRAVLSNVGTQGIAVATGLQKSFDWRGVAASAAGTGVGEAVRGALRTTHFGFGQLGDQLARGTLSGLAAGRCFWQCVRSIGRGRRRSSVAVDPAVRRCGL